MTDNNKQPMNNNNLIGRKRKWKMTERITLAIGFVMTAFLIVNPLTDFNSIFNSMAFFVLSVIFVLLCLRI